MRPLDSDSLAAIAGQVVRYAFLLHGQFISGDVYYWTGIGPLSWNGQTWFGLGKLLSIGQSQETNDLSSRGMQIGLSGVQPSDIATVLGEMQQSLEGTMYLALFDDNWSLIGTPRAIFSGRLSIPTITDQGATCTVTVNYEHQLIDLDRLHERRYTDQNQRLLYPGDSGLSRVAALVDRDLVWGTFQ